MKNKNIIFTLIIIFVIFLIFISGYLFKKNNKDSDINADINIDTNVEKLNQMADNYYLQNFDEQQFVSQFSYLMRKDKTEVTVKEITDFFGETLPAEYENIQIHFVKPKAFLKYPSIAIKKQEGENDLEVLTVYTAIPLENGSFYISSKYDKGGILSQKEYQQFVLENSPIHGEILNPEPNSEIYNEIRKATENADTEVLNGNIKYLTCDEKYAFIVISSEKNPAIIKSFLLEKNNGKWEVVRKELEKNEKYKIEINVNYPNFNLDMLPIYNLAEFKPESNVDSILEILKKQKVISQNDFSTYACVAGKFGYIEFNSGEKMLLFSNENQGLDVYKVKDSLEALQKMVSLDNINPPTFIIKFQN